MVCRAWVWRVVSRGQDFTCLRLIESGSLRRRHDARWRLAGARHGLYIHRDDIFGPYFVSTIRSNLKYSMSALQLAYIFNIAVLFPVALPTLLRLFPTDQTRFEESAGWRSITGSIWTAILVLSAIGLFAPIRFSPLLVMQVLYKLFWLLAYAVPRLRVGRRQEIPSGIAVTFLLIVLAYPWVIP